MKAEIEEMNAAYKPYIPDTWRRFGPQWVTWNPKNHFSGHLKNIRTYFDGRYDHYLDIVKKVFELGNPVNVSLRFSGEGAICINGRDEVLITGNTTMKFFPEYGITVTAIPAEGKTFKGWEVSNSYGSVEDPTALTTTFTFTRIVKLTAVFE